MKTNIWYNEELDEFIFTVEMESGKLMVSYDSYSYHGLFVKKEEVVSNYSLIGEL